MAGVMDIKISLEMLKLLSCLWFTWYCTHILKIGFVVAWGGFYSYYIHQGNKSEKKGKFWKKVKYYAYKKI